MAEEQQLETVDGIVERILYIGSGGFTALRLGLEDGGSLTARGEALLGVQPGETLQVTGRRGRHQVYGEEFHATECRYIEPATLHAIRKYLASGLVRGIGPKLADAIVDTFKLDTLQVIDTTPERLHEVHLIGPARHAEIVAAWQVHQEIRQLMVLLQGAAVSPTHAPRIAHHFRTVRREAHDVADVLDIVQEHPYRLTEVYGIGFTTADKLALWLGLPERSPERLRAALLHALETAAVRDGQCFLFERQLLHRTLQNLRDETLAELLPDELGALVASGGVVVQDVPRDGRLQAAVFTPRMHAAEASVAARIARLRSTKTRLASLGPWRGGGPLPVFDSAVQLAPAQEAAARMALTEPVSVLTGGPGCGKSFTVKSIVDLVETAGGRVGLAAPTGRAAKRLQELTGRTATTVHRMIGKPCDDAGLLNLFDAWDPLEADLIVVDEASMLDLPLLDRLLGKLTPGVHLLLVGDVHQLPSVGPGQVLRDLLTVEAVPRTELGEVFRQSADSAITTNAAQIRHGRPVRSGGDFWFLPVPDAQIPATVVDLVTRRLPAKYGITADDVQVLAPSTKGPAGTQELAAAIQAEVNPHRDGQAQHWGDGRPFRLNDRVIAVRNDIRKGVLNGSTGRVSAIDDKERHIHVTLDDDGSKVLYAFEELDELLHAYAITVHRAQGSEYPHVVVPLTKTGPSYLLLRRNLLYTAVTRARQMLVLVGDPEALEMAIKQPATARNSSLAVRLHEALTGTVVLPEPARTYSTQATLC
ncbi:ATP-dependent RecD-like DNA helicase [Kitasatospora sp. NPDC085879]|uniref:SF1B family DNA helicase RecD2 n=1 Tax=Kitasatospora sp. NPDC085879 TaxID=3154769 RepID=UPI00343BB724